MLSRKLSVASAPSAQHGTISDLLLCVSKPQSRYRPCSLWDNGSKSDATPQYPVSAGRQQFLVTSQNVPEPPKRHHLDNSYRLGDFRRNGTLKHRARALAAHGLREFPTVRCGRRVVGAHPPAAPLKTRSLLLSTGDAPTHRISKTDDCFPRKRSVVILENRVQYSSKIKYGHLKQGVSPMVAYGTEKLKTYRRASSTSACRGCSPPSVRLRFGEPSGAASPGRPWRSVRASYTWTTQTSRRWSRPTPRWSCRAPAPTRSTSGRRSPPPGTLRAAPSTRPTIGGCPFSRVPPPWPRTPSRTAARASSPAWT